MFFYIPSSELNLLEHNDHLSHTVKNDWHPKTIPLKIETGSIFIKW